MKIKWERTWNTAYTLLSTVCVWKFDLSIIYLLKDVCSLGFNFEVKQKKIFFHYGYYL